MKTLYSTTDIEKRVLELADTITSDYRGKKPVFIGVLKGSFILLADLLRAVYTKGLTEVAVDFLTVSSYGLGTESNRKPTVTHDVTTDIAGKDLLIVEDIVDTGYTLQFVQQLLKERGPHSLKTLAFLDKIERREIEVPVEYIGFRLVGTPWVEGYGLDGGAFGRGRPEIVAKTP